MQERTALICRLKKTVLCLCAVLAALLLCCPAAGRSEGKKKLTLMVYMCGSDLEGGYGYATRDLREMMRSGFPREDVSIIVMIGGSSNWALHPGLTDTMILEIGKNGQRTVRDAAQQNMGESETLTDLLVFGRENYPAERYALILWDHGGGPMEGACWDMLFSLDNLSLEEIAEGIRQADYPEKLSWIGFDACLMSSLEVATVLSPYAEYMIASQETEPSYGWNYAFLKDIATDETGADTGRRIVDLYFEGHEDSKDVLTMACLDLSKTAEIQDAFDAFFSVPALTVTQETFTQLSGALGSVTGFGKAVHGNGEDGYDLVDAGGLIASLSEGNPEADRLSALMEDLVVYSRSNDGGATGVSLYHPYVNKQKYRESWRKSYAGLGFSAGYTDYINAFGTVLLGEEMTDWSGVQITEAGFDDEQGYLFTLQLTEEQQENLASAQLLILTDLMNIHQLANSCSIVYCGQAEADENGVLSASYTGRALYIEDEDGKLLGPVDFKLTDDGKLAYIHAVYLLPGLYDYDRTTNVIFYLEPGGGTEYPEIIRTHVLDRVTMTYTNRILFSEEPYQYLHLLEFGRAIPEADGRGLLPMFDEWPEDILMGGIQLELPNQWRFRWVEEQLTGTQLYALFELTDIQQNRFCTTPIPVRNDNRTEYTGVPETETEGLELGMRAVLLRSERDREVRFVLSMDQQNAEEAEYRFEDLTVNGTRRMEYRFFRYITLGGDKLSGAVEQVMDPLELFDIDEIETVHVTMIRIRGDVKEEIPVSFRFSGCDVSDLGGEFSVLSETEEDGVTIQLLDIRQYGESGAEMDVMIRNDREKVFCPDDRITVSGYDMEVYGREDVPAGVSTLERIELKNYTTADGILTSDAEVEVSFLSRYILQRRGIRQIEEITFYAHTARRPAFSESFEIKLPEPWTIRNEKVKSVNDEIAIGDMIGGTEDPDDDPSIPASRILLAECNQYAVYLEKILVAKNGIALSLEIENRTDVSLSVCGIHPELNGTEVTFSYDKTEAWINVSPRSVRVAGMTIPGGSLAEAVTDLETVSIQFESREQREQGQQGTPCRITLTGKNPMGTDEPVWIHADQVSAESVILPDTEIPEPYVYKTPDSMMNTEVLVPENAGQYTQVIYPELTDEEAERITAGIMLVVKVRGGGLALSSVHRMTPDEDGRLCCVFPGLLLCTENDPKASVPCIQTWTDEDYTHLEAETLTALEAYDEDNTYRQRASGIVIQTDLAENHAEIASMELEGETKELQSVNVLQYVKEVPEETEGPLPAFWEWETILDGWFINWYVEMNGEPFRLMLRPITADDGIYLIFTVKDVDETIYTLDSILPYPAE